MVRLNELILIDEGSRDSFARCRHRSLSMIWELYHHDNRVRYLSLVRNFGHQVSVDIGVKKNVKPRIPTQVTSLQGFWREHISFLEMSSLNKSLKYETGLNFEKSI